jgi:hypothetical protein
VDEAKRNLAMSLAMSAAPECTVTFPIENRMFGVDLLAKRLNALVSDGRIGDWHPGSWVDWGQTSIQIGFDSIEDAALAKQLLFHGLRPQRPDETGRATNAS